MKHIQVAQWKKCRVLMMLDCCNLMSRLDDNNDKAAQQLTSDLGLGRVAADVIVGGYSDGSGVDGWNASAECCIEGFRAAWHSDDQQGDLATIAEESAKQCVASNETLGGFRCLRIGMRHDGTMVSGAFCKYGFFQSTLSEATRRTIADCVSRAELKPVLIKQWSTTRYEKQWFQLPGTWWNPRYGKQDELNRSEVLDGIISKFYEANAAGLQEVFASAPFPYARIYQDRRLLGHIAAQYYSNDALLRDSTFHYDGEECCIGMCATIGKLSRNFHIMEDDNELVYSQVYGDVYFTSFSVSQHAISRPPWDGDERDTAVLFRPLVTQKEAKEMQKHLATLKKHAAGSKRPDRETNELVEFYKRLASFIINGPIAP